MRDVDKASSSNHHHHHRSGPSNSKTITIYTTIPEIKTEANHALELVKKVVDDMVNAKWILTTVLKSLSEMESKPQKCANCEKGHGHSSSSNSRKEGASSPSKEKKDKKAKKAVLPMVSGHTIQRPNLNIVRVDDQQRSRDQQRQENQATTSSSNRPGPSSNKVSSSSKRRDSDNNNSKKKRSRSRSRGRTEKSSSSKKKRSRGVSSSSSSSSSSSGSSSSSSSSSRSRSRSVNNRANERNEKKTTRTKSDNEDLLSIGGSEVRNKKEKPGPSKPSSSKHTTSSHKKPPQSTASSSHSSDKNKAKPPTTTTSPVHPHGSASTRFLSSVETLDNLKRKHKIREVRVRLIHVTKLLQYGQKSVNLNDLEERHVQMFWTNWKKKIIKKETTITPPSRKMIGPKSKMAGINKAAPTKSTTAATTTAEMLRAKLREKFNKFKIDKAKNEPTMPDSTTNSSSKDNDVRPTSSTAAHSELAAIGLSVFVSKEPKRNESVDEVVGKVLGDGARNELLEMKRDDWIMMQNRNTGVETLKDHVQEGIRKVVGGQFEMFSGCQGNDKYTVGNYYLVAKEGHPLQLMRYVGSSANLPPCADEDESHPPGFVPLDLSSLSSVQISQLHELGSNKSRGSSNSEDEESDDDGVRRHNVKMEDDEPIIVAKNIITDSFFDEGSSEED